MQLAATEDRKNKQLNGIEKQKEKDKIVYLEDGIDQLFEAYPKSFDKKSKSLLNTLVKNEHKVNYKNMSYKMLFPDGRFDGRLFE